MDQNALGIRCFSLMELALESGAKTYRGNYCRLAQAYSIISRFSFFLSGMQYFLLEPSQAWAINVSRIIEKVEAAMLPCENHLLASIGQMLALGHHTRTESCSMLDATMSSIL